MVIPRLILDQLRPRIIQSTRKSKRYKSRIRVEGDVSKLIEVNLLNHCAGLRIHHFLHAPKVVCYDPVKDASLDHIFRSVLTFVKTRSRPASPGGPPFYSPFTPTRPPHFFSTFT